MPLQYKLHVIADGLSTGPRRTYMLQITMPNENIVWKDGNELYLHKMRCHLHRLYWHVGILMGSVGSPQLRELGSCRNIALLSHTYIQH